VNGAKSKDDGHLERGLVSAAQMTRVFAQQPGTAETSTSPAQATTHFTSQVDAEPAPLESAATPPAVFGRYEVRRALGSGAFGTVYVGHDTQLDRPVAIKVLRAGPGLAAADSGPFLLEARRLARLRHPGIVTVHDVGVQDGSLYIVSDYLDGVDLDRWLKSNRAAWTEAARIVAAVADALAHAHERLVIHRDIKPANIVLTADGTPVVVDFGLALDELAAGGREKGRISGTPWYMSPEQATGTAHRVDGRTDIYSLGVLFYQLLTGRVPFQADDPMELLRQVRDDDPQPPRQVARDVPPEIERICLKALSKRPNDRYTTAADFAEDVRRALQSAPQAVSFAASSVVTPRGESHAVPPSSQFDSAGRSASQRRAREAERRQVTVLVCGCELFESQEYLENLDAEDQAQVLRAFQQSCQQAARRFGGTVVQCNEQGLVACFGYPVAYEDAARRAAHSGLEIAADMARLSERLSRMHELELKAWVGVHTGPALVEGEDEAVSLVGEARNVALRLQDAAAPGRVVCSEVTHRLIRASFDCVSLGQRKIKGVAQPIELFEVQKVGQSRSAIDESAPAGLTPLTGRDHEINLLKDRWEQAQEGMGQVVLLVGEPGLGKSRLVHTLKQHVQEQTGDSEDDAPVIEWRCSPQYQNTALYPVIDFYERALAFNVEESPQARFDRMLDRLQRDDLARPEVVPLWAALLSLPVPDWCPNLSLPPVRQREETFRLILEWLHVQAAGRPTLFVVEDLHWADASTLEFLKQFLAEGLHDRILTVFTFRPEFQAPWPALAHQTSLALTRLTRRQVGDLMRKMGTDLSDALVDQVYDRGGGVPLFVEEFTKMAQESRVPAQAVQGLALAPALAEREIPSTLQDLITARLDRMEGGRELAQLAAVVGREFNYELLSAVALADEPALDAELARLVQAEILLPKGRPPNCSYRFKHALWEDALYNALVKDKRRQIHRRVAEVLEARFPLTVETQPELVAYHATEAGLTDKAIAYWLKAGLRSRARSAAVEAIGHLTKGLGLLTALDESPERDSRELEFLGPLGTAYLEARGYAAPEAGPVFHRARTLCERSGQSTQLYAIMVGIWEWQFVRGEIRQCTGLVAEAKEYAGRLHDAGAMMEAFYIAGQTLLYQADFAGARDCFATALAEFDDRERVKFWVARTGHDASVACRANLAVSLWHLGCPSQALKIIQEMCQLAREIGDPFAIAYALHHTAWLHHYCRLGVEVQAAAEEEIAISAKQGFALWHATGTFFKGAGMLLQGKLEESLPLLVKGHDTFQSTGAQLHRPFQLSVLGDAHIQAARFGVARAALDEGLAVAEKNDERLQEAELHRLRGDLLMAESPEKAVAAEDCFLQAIETARRQRSRAWELRATMSLARLWQRQGRCNEARDALATVYNTYTEGLATPDLVDAKLLLNALV
jgi:class 3 adenylate cyclase/predicted ATPase